MRTILMIALALGSAACADESPPPTIAGQERLPRREWLRTAQRGLRIESCTEGGVFRRCSDTNRDECEQTIAAALRQCADGASDRLPDSIAAGTEDQRLRQELMGCMWHHAGFALGPARVDMLCLMSPPAS